MCHTRYRRHRLLDRVDDETGRTGFQYFGNGSAPERDDRRAACHRLDHDEPEWLRPVDREEQRLGPGEEVRLVVFADLADEFHVWMGLDHRANLGLPIGLVD